MSASRRSRKAPSQRDRRSPNNGQVILASRPGVNTAVSIQPPPLAEGQGRCPVCRAGAAITINGFLRVHRDLFGNHCNNRIWEDAPRVKVDELPSPTEALRPTGECHGCEKKITPGRLFCGRCMARRL